MNSAATSPEAAFASPTDYTEDGVNLTLIRWILSLTPAERLRYAEDYANDILTIREWNVWA